ncbi:MAG: peptidylprolyl isomerase [Candidatus Nanohaloarchaea archaeon]
MEKGDLVLVDYVGRTDGEIFDLSDEEKAKEEGVYSEDQEYRPIPVLVGYEYVIPGFEEEIEDMEVDEEREFTVPAEKGYGERDSDMVETYPEKEFQRQDVNVRVGEQVMIGRRRGKVVSKGSGRVKIDFNHPLAGKDLDYWVHVREKVEDDEEKAEKIFEYRLGHGEIEFEGDKVVIGHHHDEGHEHQLPQEVKDAVRDEILENTGFEEVEWDED